MVGWLALCQKGGPNHVPSSMMYDRDNNMSVEWMIVVQLVGVCIVFVHEIYHVNPILNIVFRIDNSILMEYS